MFDEMFKRITPDGDFDGDGVSNRDEWAQGTDATDPSSGASDGRGGVGSDVSVNADKTWKGKPGEELPGRKLAEKKTADEASDEEPDGWQPRVTIVEDSVEASGYLLHHGSDDNYVAVGAEGKASYEVGFEDGNATVEAEAGGFLGAIAKVRQEFEEGVVSGDAEATVSVGSGATVSVKGEIGTDGAAVAGKIGAHLGGKAQVEASGEAMGVTVGGGVGVSYGLQGEAELDCEITFENVGCEVEAGLALGVGANAKGELGFSPEEFVEDATELVEEHPEIVRHLGGPVASAAIDLAGIGEEKVAIFDGVREQIVDGANEVHGSTASDGSTNEQPGSSVWDLVAAPMREALDEAQGAAMSTSSGDDEYGMSMLDDVATHDPQIDICEPDPGTVDPFDG